MKPLADLLRPNKLEDVVGQKHLLNEHSSVYKIIKSNKIPNMLFYGPPGVGKTTVANIIANSSKMKLFKLNG
ncbi:MAG: AAA family ATPase, partial [Bacilli bacterium]|nr:AAA family ATPase [Bacilli bacterium]